jgi:hypothetical protein
MPSWVWLVVGLVVLLIVLLLVDYFVTNLVLNRGASGQPGQPGRADDPFGALLGMAPLAAAFLALPSTRIRK